MNIRIFYSDVTAMQLYEYISLLYQRCSESSPQFGHRLTNGYRLIFNRKLWKVIFKAEISKNIPDDFHVTRATN